MSALTFTEKLGFMQEVVKFMEDHTEELKASGLDVSKLLTEQEKKIKNVIAENAKQEDMKAALKKQTQKTNESMDVAYKGASDAVAAMSGILSKTSPLSKSLSRLRSKARIGSRTPAPAAPNA